MLDSMSELIPDPHQIFNKVINTITQPFNYMVERVIPNLTSEESFSIISIELLSRYYYVTDLAFEFIKNSPKLAKFLATEAYEEIRKYFPSEKLTIDLVADPEFGDQLLTIYINTNLKPKEALKKLKQLDEEWWLDKAPEYKSLCIHLQFV